MVEDDGYDDFQGGGILDAFLPDTEHVFEELKMGIAHRAALVLKEESDGDRCLRVVLTGIYQIGKGLFKIFTDVT